ncbi:MAG: hypothetical protein KJO38_04525, partial [Gammaproteobacteria bacterium]|nr:hypothetical protein [Gammaproteobacteria bacterium]
MFSAGMILAASNAEEILTFAEMIMMWNKACALALLTLGGFGQSANAATAFSSFDSGGFGSGTTVWVVEGFQFRPNVEIFVTE